MRTDKFLDDRFVCQASGTLALKRRPLARDVFTYSFSLLLLVYFIRDGCVGLAEAGFLFALYPCYIAMLALAPKCRAMHKESEANKPESLYDRFMDDTTEEMIKPKLGRTRSFVLEVQAEEAATEARENKELIDNTFTEDEIFNMRRAFNLFVTTEGSGKCPRPDVWRILQVLGEAAHSHSDGETLIGRVETEDEAAVDFTEFCLAMAKKDEVEPWHANLLHYTFLPLELAFKYTCPDCEYGGPGESWCAHRTLRSAH